MGKQQSKAAGFQEKFSATESHTGFDTGSRGANLKTKCFSLPSRPRLFKLQFGDAKNGNKHSKGFDVDAKNLPQPSDTQKRKSQSPTGPQVASLSAAALPYMSGHGSTTISELHRSVTEPLLASHQAGSLLGLGTGQARNGAHVDFSSSTDSTTFDSPRSSTRRSGLFHAHAQMSSVFPRESSIAHPSNSSMLSTPWMNQLNDFLVFTQWGDKDFYTCDFKGTWLSVDEEELKLHSASIYRKFGRELAAAFAISFVAFLTYPLRLVIAIPFWRHVLRNTRSQDFVHRRTRRMLTYTMLNFLIYMGALLALRVVYLTWLSAPDIARPYLYAIDPDYGRIPAGYITTFLPFKCWAILVVLTVIRKQRRDMTYLVNVIRHHLVLDEEMKGGHSEVSIGPVCQSRRRWWLLDEVLAPDGTPTNRLRLHGLKVRSQLAQLAIGTGAVSEMADIEADMFHRQGMKDLLENRSEMLDDIEEVLTKMRDDESDVRCITVDFQRLVQVLCAGYPGHFVEEEEIMPGFLLTEYQSGSDLLATFIAFMYVLFPAITLVWRGTLVEVLCELHSYPWEIKALVPIAAFISFVTDKELFARLFDASKEIRRKLGSLVVLQRLASTHHSRREAGIMQEEKRNNTFWLSEDTVIEPEDRHSPSLLGDDEQHRARRMRFRERASRMRGNSSHISVVHKHNFDKIMERSYGATAANGHCHCFVELDLHDHGQLRMWWNLRRFLEAGLLHEKVNSEFELFLAVFLFVVLVLYAISWYLLVGRTVCAHAMDAWETLFLGFGALKLLKSCVDLNDVLASDGSRLSLIRHDLILSVAEDETRRCAQASRDLGYETNRPTRQVSLYALTDHGRTMRGHRSKSSTSLHSGTACTWADESHVANEVYSASVQDRNLNNSKITEKLLGILIDHIDRDYHPFTLGGANIDRALLGKVSALIASGIMTSLVQLAARTAFSIQQQARLHQ